MKQHPPLQGRTAQIRADADKLTVHAGQIFISYRREDTAPTAGRIYDRLIQHFGKDAVFKDVDNIPYATNFRRHIEGVIEHCAVLLAIIGPGWLEATEPSGQRRLDDPGDFVRLEIEAAVQRCIAVIPVLVQGASVPERDRLPPSLAELPNLNAVFVRNDPDFNGDMYRLQTTIERLIGEYEQEQARLKAEADARARQEAAEAKRARREAAAAERAQRRAGRAQTLAKLPGPLAGLLANRWVPRILGIIVAILVALGLGALLLSESGVRLGGFGLAASTPIPTATPTFDAGAATQTEAISQATATAVAATATAVFISPYVAPLPGKCDQGGATWQSAENNGLFPGSMSCTSDSLVITGHAWAGFEGAPSRAGYSPSGIPPVHFRASVDVSFGSSGSNGSPQIVGQFDTIAYVFQIHSSGTWELSVYSSAQYTGGNRGQTPAATSYTLVMTTQGGVVTFSVNGRQVDKLNLPSGSEQSTGTFIGNDSGGPIYCRNFVFTPLA